LKSDGATVVKVILLEISGKRRLPPVEVANDPKCPSNALIARLLARFIYHHLAAAWVADIGWPLP
jgi:hypothetical protein